MPPSASADSHPSSSSPSAPLDRMRPFLPTIRATRVSQEKASPCPAVVVLGTLSTELCGCLVCGAPGCLRTAGYPGLPPTLFFSVCKADERGSSLARSTTARDVTGPKAHPSLAGKPVVLCSVAWPVTEGGGVSTRKANPTSPRQIHRTVTWPDRRVDGLVLARPCAARSVECGAEAERGNRQ